MESETTQSDTHQNGPTPVLDYSRLPSPKPQVTFGGQIMKAAVIGSVAILVDAFALYPRMPLFYGLLIWTIVIAASLLRLLAHIMPDIPDGPRWRLAVFSLFLLIFVLPIRVHSCDHATTYANLCHLGFSYSRTGGPCNNAPHHGGQHLIGNWYFSGLF